MARTTMRSSKGKKLYAKRDKKGQFTPKARSSTPSATRKGSSLTFKVTSGPTGRTSNASPKPSGRSAFNGKGTLFHPGRWLSMKDMITNRNLVFLIAGALIAVVAILSYRAYENNREPKGVQINVGPGGISLEKK
jgi:hypothetical protein